MLNIRRGFKKVSYKMQLEGLKNLTPREKTVASLVILGYSNEEIAKKLEITHHTIKAHIANILKKTQTMNRCRLAYLIGSYEDRAEFVNNPDIHGK